GAGSVVNGGHGPFRPAGIDGKVLVRVGEAELEGELGPGIAVVVDANLVERLRIEREVVRSAVSVLEGIVVRDEGDEILAAGFVAAEHVEVGAIDLRLPGDERCLAVTRGERDERYRGGGARHQARENHVFHGSSPFACWCAW